LQTISTWIKKAPARAANQKPDAPEKAAAKTALSPQPKACEKSGSQNLPEKVAAKKAADN
jgi:hypothetical protein